MYDLRSAASKKGPYLRALALIRRPARAWTKRATGAPTFLGVCGRVEESERSLAAGRGLALRAASPGRVDLRGGQPPSDAGRVPEDLE